MPNSALNLNGGQIQLPPDSYFNSPQFTITIWIKPENVIFPYARILEFSNGCHNNTVGILLDQDSSPIFPKFEMYELNAQNQYQLPSSISLVVGIWQHVTITYDGSQMRFYLNANLVDTSDPISYVLPMGNWMRTENYIGGTSCGYNGFSSSHVDDLRIFNTSLSRLQINDVMMSNETSFDTLICANSNTLSYFFFR